MSYFIKTISAIALMTSFSAPLAAQDADYDVGAMMMATDGSDADISAATGWHICTIVRAGAGWGSHYVSLTCPSGPFTNKWHILNAAQKEAMLATALAAAASNSKIQVAIGGVTSGYNRINAIYLHK